MFVEEQIVVAVWVYFRVFYSIPLVYMSVLCQYIAVFVTMAL
jgi:hypothetical protein